MTVCIAIRSEGMLLLASDRMLTSGDIQFDPPVRKLLFLTSSIVIMFSGDAALHSEIVQELMREVKRRVDAAPEEWLNVKDVVDLYIKFWNAARSRRAEAKILAPLSLDHESFLTSQNSMDSALVNQIAEDLVNFRVSDLEAIVAGIDLRHGFPLPSIHTIYNGNSSCEDQVAFAAIGSGARHAESLLMLARHSFQIPNAEALLSLYMAKKNAEVAPGVGAETDLLALGPNVGQSIDLRGEVEKKLEEEFKKIKAKDDKVRQKARAEMARYVNEFGKKAAATQDKPPATKGEEIAGVSEAKVIGTQ